MLRKNTNRIILWALPCALAVGPLLGAAEESAHAEGGGGIAGAAMQFMKTSGWGIIVFAVVLFVLWKKLFPPIVEALDRRERAIRESLEAAERAKKESEEMLAKHEESLEKARGEARAIIDESIVEARKAKDSIVDSARNEARGIAERATREIELAKQSAVQDLYRQAARLSLEIAEKVIQKSLGPEDHQELIDSAIQKYLSEGN